MRHPDVGFGDQPALMILKRKHLVDRRQHALRRSKRLRQPHMREFLAASREPPPEFAPHLAEHVGGRALERKDRLLLIANREKCARRRAAGAGREVARQPLQYSPLRRARILRLVDEDMIDAGVELVEHPGRFGTFEQRQRLGDEIVEIEDAPRGLDRVIAFEDRVDEASERDRALKGFSGFQLRTETIETGLFLEEFGF